MSRTVVAPNLEDNQSIIPIFENAQEDINDLEVNQIVGDFQPEAANVITADMFEAATYKVKYNPHVFYPRVEIKNNSVFVPEFAGLLTFERSFEDNIASSWTDMHGIPNMPTVSLNDTTIEQYDPPTYGFESSKYVGNPSHGSSCVKNGHILYNLRVYTGDKIIFSGWDRVYYVRGDF